MNTGQPDVVSELLTLNNVPVAGRPGIPVTGIDVPAAVVRMAVVMANRDPPIEVRMNTEVLRSLRQNVLDLWLSISLSLWGFVLQNLTDVDGDRFDLRAVGQVNGWKLDRTVIAIADLILQILWKLHFEIRFSVMVFSISQDISRAAIVQNITGDCVAGANVNLWFSKASVDRGIGVISERDASVSDPSLGRRLRTVLAHSRSKYVAPV